MECARIGADDASLNIARAAPYALLCEMVRNWTMRLEDVRRMTPVGGVHQNTAENCPSGGALRSEAIAAATSSTSAIEYANTYTSTHTHHHQQRTEVTPRDSSGSNLSLSWRRSWERRSWNLVFSVQKRRNLAFTCIRCAAVTAGRSWYHANSDQEPVFSHNTPQLQRFNFLGSYSQQQNAARNETRYWHLLWHSRGHTELL